MTVYAEMSDQKGFATDEQIAALQDVGVVYERPAITEENYAAYQAVQQRNQLGPGGTNYAGATLTANGTSVQTFTGTLSALMPGIDSKVITELWGAYVKNYGADPNVDLSLVPDMIIGSEDTPLFNQEFGAYLEIRNNPSNTTGITSLGDFMNARKGYADLMNYYGIKEMGTKENVDKFIANNISLTEAQARMQTAYDAVLGADDVLKSQLGRLNVSEKDLVKAILLGPDGRQELENKIKTANINAAEVEAGITSVLGARQLALQGITRDQARQGLSTVAGATPGYQGAAARALQSTGDIQKILEQEQLLGMKSARRARLGVREQGLIAGQSGVTTGSLNRGASGKF